MCSAAFSGNDGPNSVLVTEANSSPDSWLNDTRSLLYSSRIPVLRSAVHCEEALSMKVKAAFTAPSISSTESLVLLLTLSSKSLSGPTASRNSAWILEREVSADYRFFEHSAATTLSSHEAAVKGMSSTIKCCQSCLRSALLTEVNAVQRNSSVELCTWVRRTLSLPGWSMEPSRSSISSSNSIHSPQVSLMTMPSSSALSELLVTGMKVALCAIVLFTTLDTEATGSSAAWLWAVYPHFSSSTSEQTLVSCFSIRSTASNRFPIRSRDTWNPMNGSVSVAEGSDILQQTRINVTQPKLAS